MDKICIFSIIFAVIITAFLINGKMQGTASAASDGENSQFAEEDLEAGWDASGAEKILLDGEEIRISGGGAYSYDGDVYIARAGKYVLSGELTDGSVIIDADKSDKIWILLDGVSLNCADSAAVLVEQAGKVFLTLAPDTENVIMGGCAEDGLETVSGDATAGNLGEEGRAVFGREETVSGDAENGEGTEGNPEEERAVFGREETVFGDAENVAGAAKNPGEKEKMVVWGEDVVFGDTGDTSGGIDGAVYSRDDLTINGSGSLTVTGRYQHGIVCNDDLVVAGGTIAVTAVQDGIHANDSARFTGMDLTIHAGDDGVTVSNDEDTGYIYMESGSIAIPDCYEGLEAVNVTIAGGTLDLAPTDDGINANGGEESVLAIGGGDITIVNTDGRDADGLDSNGNIRISGGNIRISVTGNGGNCALDCGSENGGTCEISGGTVIACGGSAMAEGFSSSSEQNFIMYNGAAGEAGTMVTLKNSEGTVLLSEEVPCSFTSVIISTPDMQEGEACTLTIGDQEEEVTVDNISGSAGMTGMFRGMGRMQGGRKGMAGRGTGSARPVNATVNIRRTEEIASDLTGGESAEGILPESPNDQVEEINPPEQPDNQAEETNPPGQPDDQAEETNPPEQSDDQAEETNPLGQPDDQAEEINPPEQPDNQAGETNPPALPNGQTGEVNPSGIPTFADGVLSGNEQVPPEGIESGENGAAFWGNRRRAEMNGNTIEETSEVSGKALILTSISALFLLGGLLAALKIGR